MNRRKFTQAFGAASGLAGLGLHQGSLASIGSANTPSGSASWAEQFARAMQNHPWLLAYQNIQQPAYAATAKLVGKWPSALSGTLYRNGPAQHEVHGYRYHHWFDGDGMLQAWRINAGGKAGVSHQARLIATHKLLAEQDAGRALYPGFASVA